jgi:spore coat polysaccharide biosynthesis protein SpsF (cytidylyltransferase family)
MYHLGDESVLWHVLSRALRIPDIDEVICATVDDPVSQVIVDTAHEMGVHVVLGPERDVLKRYWKAGRGHNVIMRITSDCPLIDPTICWEVLQLLDGVAYASNCFPRNCNKGLDCEVFTYQALALAHKTTNLPYDREHVTPWMQRNLKTRVLPGTYDPTVNLCLDTPKDYIRLKGMFNEPIPGSKRL